MTTRRKVATGFFALIAAAVIGNALWFFLPQSLVIDDFRSIRTYRLDAHRSDEFYSLDIAGHGDFRGKVSIELMAGDRPLRSVIIEDGAAFKWRFDWYEPQARIRVTPLTGTTGELTLRYRFIGLF